MKKKLISLLLLLLITFNCIGQKQKLLQILEKAGKQRMLCEQVTKNYFMIGAAVKPEDSQSEFDDAKFTFSKNLLFLTENAKTSETKLSVKNLSNLWTNFKTLIETKPTLENAIIVMNQSYLVQIACKEMVSKIHYENNIKNSKLLNLCDKQRYNTQKIAKFCIARNWKIAYLELEKDLNEALTSYEFSLSQMLTSPENTPETSKILSQQLKDWSLHKDNFVFETNTNSAEKAIEKTNIILNELNKLILLFQKNTLTINGISG